MANSRGTSISGIRSLVARVLMLDTEIQNS